MNSHALQKLRCLARVADDLVGDLQALVEGQRPGAVEDLETDAVGDEFAGVAQLLVVFTGDSGEAVLFGGNDELTSRELRRVG